MISVINESRFYSMKMKMFVTIIINLIFLASDCRSEMNTNQKERLNCDQIRSKLIAVGHGDNANFVDEPVPGSVSKLCPKSSWTCCQALIETKLLTNNRRQFNLILQETMNVHQNHFSFAAQKFDEFFRELLNTSKTDFHKMFLTTYGLLYEKNSFIFTSMFNELERYYHQPSSMIDLRSVMEKFFHTLYKKMFQVLNAQYSFDENYLNCIGKYMDHLRPFGDVQSKLTVEVRRSFIAARTFHSALKYGKDIFRLVTEMNPSTECGPEFMRMFDCPICVGSNYDRKPCYAQCTIAMKSCLNQYIYINKYWNIFIDSLMTIITRLQTSFNIESVINPIDIKISEAIMNFQENGHLVSQQLFKNCGKPSISKRSINSDDDGKLKYDKEVLDDPKQPDLGTRLTKMLMDIRSEIILSKDYWLKLPELLCSNSSFAQSNNNDCFNLTESSSTEAQKGTKSSTRISYLIMTLGNNLNLASGKLAQAYNGLDVVWNISDADTTENLEANSGSGSGSGEDDDEEEDEDDDEDENSGESDGDIYFPDSSRKSQIPKKLETSTQKPIDNNNIDDDDDDENVDQTKKKIEDEKYVKNKKIYDLAKTHHVRATNLNNGVQDSKINYNLFFIHFITFILFKCLV